MNSNDLLFSPRELAEFAGVSPATIKREVARAARAAEAGDGTEGSP